jgi:hypothetical protein
MMKNRFFNNTWLSAPLLGLLVSCGGGGGGGAAPSAQSTAAKLADSTAPAAFDFSAYDSYVGLSSKVLLSKVPEFVLVNAKTTYVTVWYVNEDGARQQVYFGNLESIRCQDTIGGLTLRVPSNVPLLHYQIYDVTQTSHEVTV